MPPYRTHRHGESGMALLEVIVAFIIAAAALSVLFSGSLDGLRNASVASRTEEALSHARSRLAVIGRGERMIAGESEGDDGGGYRFVQHILPVASLPSDGGTLYAVEVEVSWQDGAQTRVVRLATERLVGPR